MKIYFYVVNGPADLKSFRVDASGPWGSNSRSGSYPQTPGYPDSFDIGESGTFSIYGWDAGWKRIEGGSSSYSGLVPNGVYNIDFVTGEAIATYEAPPEEEAPPTAAEHPLAFLLAILTPWGPLSGPPLPRVFPPWPWGMSTWKEFWEEVI